MSFSKVRTKNMDLSKFIIGAYCEMAQDLNLFSQDKKKDFFEPSSIIEVLVKIKEL